MNSECVFSPLRVGLVVKVVLARSWRPLDENLEVVPRGCRRVCHLSDHRQHHRRQNGEHLWSDRARGDDYLRRELHLGDVLTEVYGYRQARLVIWLGFCKLLAVVAIPIGGWLPSAPFWHDQADYQTILGYSARLLLASFLAYLIGESGNSLVLARLKVVTRGRFLWMRTISSTLVGHELRLLVFMSVAFLGTIPGSGLANAVVTQWLFKTVQEAAATPLTYAVVSFLKREERVGSFDRNVSMQRLPLES